MLLSYLELLEGEASPCSGLHVVLESLALDDGTQRTRRRAREDLHGLLLPCCDEDHVSVIDGANNSRILQGGRNSGHDCSGGEPRRSGLPLRLLVLRAGWLNQVLT